MLASLWRNHSLIYALSKREVVGRYRGSYFGILWSFLNPLLMLSIYTFIFSNIFKAKWNIHGDSKIEFALILFIGLIIYNLFSECINRAPSLILWNANYVKKVVFPLEVLPWVDLFSALFHTFISLLVWFLAYLMFYGAPNPTLLYLPLVLTPFIFLIVGLSWVLTALGVYLRDVSQFIGLLTTMLMFLSPIFYPASAFPEAYRNLLYLNPLTFVIEQMREILFWGNAPDVIGLTVFWLMSIFFMWFGFVLFQKARKGFADVL